MPQNTVQEYIEIVQVQHNGIVAATVDILDRARQAGEALNGAIAASQSTDMPIDHGKLGDWYRTAFPTISVKSLQNYRRIALNWNEVQANWKSMGVNTLSGALKALSTPRLPKPDAKPVTKPAEAVTAPVALTWADKGSPTVPPADAQAGHDVGEQDDVLADVLVRFDQFCTAKPVKAEKRTEVRNNLFRLREQVDAAIKAFDGVDGE